jgi:hypothetical protein
MILHRNIDTQLPYYKKEPNLEENKTNVSLSVCESSIQTYKIYWAILKKKVKINGFYLRKISLNITKI